MASREVQSYKAKVQPTSNSITCELVITFSAVFFLSVDCTRGTCETMAKKRSFVLYVLLLGVFQDRTTASWMLVFLFWCTFPFFKIKNRSFSNLMDKYLSGGGIADVFSFLLCFSRWMGISALGTRSDANLTTCYGVPGLSSQQMSVCQSKPDLIPSLRRGANLGITECQRQFEKERWNCSTTNSSSVFGEIINIGEFKLNLV